MQFETDQHNDVTIINIYEQKITARIADEFKQNLISLINGGNLKLILNLEEVEFIDSSGLGAIIAGLKTLGQRGDIIICNLQEGVMQMFSLTRMDKVFKIFKNQKEALAHFNP